MNEMRESPENVGIWAIFTGVRQQEIITSHGTRLDVRPDPQTGKVATILSTDVFGSIRSLAAFRLTKDYAIVGSDSGRIIILDYDPKTSSFVKLHQETLGKSGERRIVPGQYLAVDPKGPSVMISAMEKSKLVYILNRDAAANLTISSPLEAHKNGAIIHHIVGLDVGFENPTFAALEVDYTESDQDPTGEAFKNAEKMLTMNWILANLLLQVPGGQLASSDRFDGPSGVLVCCEDHIIYRHMDAPQHHVLIPRRKHPLDNRDRGMVIVSAVMHKTKGAFFFLVQNEDGDLFKVTIEHEDEEVKSLKIKYFDTVPVASSLCILKSGFLFVASEFLNDYFYPFQKLGDDDEEPEFSPTSYRSFGMADPTAPLPNEYFRPRPLEILHLLTSLNLEESVSSDLPGIPNAVWTTKKREDDAYDSYIILSFVNGTLVLSIGETIEEVRDTGFLSSARTLAVQQIGTDALLQVHPEGIRHSPSGKTIVNAATNKRQVVVALSSAELVYFELDQEGQLNEYQDRKAMGSTVLALSIAEVPEGRQRTPFLAVGCEDRTVRVISLDPESTLETISLQALTAPPSSIYIAEMLDASINKSQPTLFVNIGLQNGVLLRTVLDPTNGQLTDTRTRFLGTRPVKLIHVQIQRSPAFLALSSRSWLNYTHQNLMYFKPLIFESFDFAWSFSAELSPEGITGSTLRIFQIPKLGTQLKQDSIPLSYTPRKFIAHGNYFYMVEGDHREDAGEKKLAELRQQGKKIDQEVIDLPVEVFGRPPKAPAGTWGSAIRVIDPVKAETVAYIPLDSNEAAFSLAVVPFLVRGGELHLGFLRTYKFTDEGRGLELLHKTETDDVPLALLAFQGRLVAGVGKALRIYDIGKKLLRKVENKIFASPIITLNTQGSRIIVGEMPESVSFVAYKAPENRLLVFADDSQSRWVSAVAIVDYTVAIGDRFGNIIVNRLDTKESDQTKMVAHFHVGDLIPSIRKVAMVAGGREILLYTGLHGTVGILVPFVSKEDVDFISTLEQHLRTEQSSLVGRDQLSWRGYYTPVKAVVDGDLCETFARLPGSKKSAI
ncbi:CPSF A subunit region-domain-containing protein [Lentinula edodes]|uniref:CPSF A subunit region-domain-containing protein n=1 Tax=Lentinula lateritia TaxID=40482 RepID=A0A9W9A715_9AGAR|nr:CPSF A subunit region-domain-containing protein [Lentinula edodes]